MVAERGEINQPKRDDGDDPGIDQHPEHQPLVHHREDLTPLPHQAEPLGPCDESGRRGVHQSESLSLSLRRGLLPPPEEVAGALPLPRAPATGKGASGSAAAVLTGFVAAAGFAAALTAWASGFATTGL